MHQLNQSFNHCNRTTICKSSVKWVFILHVACVLASGYLLRNVQTESSVAHLCEDPGPRSEGIKSDSATIFRRFCNQISAIPQPKKDDSATKLRAIQQPKSASLCNQDPCCYTLHGIVSKRGGVGWGGGGQERSCSCVPSFGTSAATLNMASSPDGGVGWGGDTNVLAKNVLGAALVSSCPWFRNHPWFHNIFFVSESFLVSESPVLVSESTVFGCRIILGFRIIPHPIRGSHWNWYGNVMKDSDKNGILGFKAKELDVVGIV